MSVYIFGPRKNKACRPVFVSREGISNAICDPVLHLLHEGLNIINIWWYYPVPISKNSSCIARLFSVRNCETIYFSKMSRTYMRAGRLI